jgi:hypothetical protein
MSKRTTKFYGEKVEVNYDGNQWVSPHNGQQHVSAQRAMRSELEAFIEAGGDDPAEEEFAEEIEDAIEAMASEAN